MFEYFTDQAIETIMFAQEEARRLRQSSVGTEAVLLGLLRQDDTIAASVLNELGADLITMRSEVEKIVGRGAGASFGELPFTPKTRQILERALQKAQMMGTRYVRAEHILLALVDDSQGVAIKVLGQLGLNPAAIREQITRAQVEPAAVGQPAPSRKPISSKKLVALNELAPI